MTDSRPRWSPRGLTVAIAAGAAVAMSLPAVAATSSDWNPTGTQFVNEDCARNEYVIDATITGDTDDGGGFDDVLFQVWDDGEVKDEAVVEVPVGETVEVTEFLSFVGLFGTGAPGVGLQLDDIDAAGDEVAALQNVDPFLPDEVDGPCEFGVERIGGANRIETAALLSQRFVRADTVVLATSEKYPDALSAAPLAAQLDGPLLLTKPGALPADTQSELERLTPDTVMVVGGEAAVSAAVVTEVETVLPGVVVERLGGAHRYETSADIAKQITQDSTPEAMLATGEDFPDALLLGALAARRSAPVVLTKSHDLSSEAADFFAGKAYDDLWVGGGTDALADAVAMEAATASGAAITRFAGGNRYETAALVMAEFPAEGDVMVATGAKFPDALTGVPVAARTGIAVGLSMPDSLPSVVETELSRIIAGDPAPTITMVGGEAALSATVKAELETLFAGPIAPVASTATSNVPD